MVDSTGQASEYVASLAFLVVINLVIHMRFLFILLMFVLASINVKAQSSLPVKEQCAATTVKGSQCKNTATKGQSKCMVHSDSRSRCGASTASGAACRIGVKTPGDKCRFHASSSKQ
jgi:hypothetical protein